MKAITLLKRFKKCLSASKNILKFGGFVTINVAKINNTELLKDKKILITGGGSGIGYSIAKKCVDTGAKVLITGRNESKLIDAINSIGGNNIHYMVWDISEVSKIDSNMNLAFEKMKGIDILVNNAGVQTSEYFPDVSESEWDRVYDTNSKGTFFMCEAICKKWLSTPATSHRKILNICSQGGFVGATYPYRLSKWDIRGLTEGLAQKVAQHGIIVNGIAPGIVKTNMQKALDTQGDNVFCDMNPLQRACLKEEISEMAAFMMSDACCFMVGQTVLVDGGYSLK